MLNPINQHATRGDQPKQRIHQINPNGILHSLDPIIVCPRTDIHLAEDAKERDPQDEEYEVPDEEEGDPRDEGDEVERCGDGGEGGGYFCVDPFSIAVFVLAIRFMQIYTIETTDCEGENELYEAED